MEIGPIGGVRPVATVRPRERSADLGKVFAAELRHQGMDADESPNEKASRGLEDEGDAADGAAGEESAEAGGASDSTVSFFA